jgi:hypothetical protein
VLAAIERSHTAVGLVPDAEVLELGEHRPAGSEQFAHVAPIHAHERNGAAARERCGMPECLLQEAGECFDRHFADAHGEFAVADATKPCHVSVDRDVVGRVGEQEVRTFVPHQQVKNGLVSSIPADQTMAPEMPHIARPRDSARRVIGSRVDLIVGLDRTVRGALARLIEYEFDLGRRKAGELDLEIDVDEGL